MSLNSAQSNGLWFYQWFERLGWPRSYFGKVFLIAFIAIHIPLLCFIVYFLFNQANPAGGIIFLLLLLATLGGSILFFWAWQQMLEPVLLVKWTLTTYVARHQVIELPTYFRDEVGLLLKHTADNVQRLEQSQVLLEQIAAEDLLTGLANRRAADKQLQQNLSLSGRQRLPVGIALLNVDNFQRINERYGYEVGERVVVQLAQLLKDRLRGGDWVARWGKEEFLVVIFAGTDSTHTTLERIRDEVANLNTTAQIKLTVSIGFTMARGAKKPQACLERAAVALSQAKLAGQNRVEFSQPFL